MGTGLNKAGNRFSDFLDKHTGMTAGEMGKAMGGQTIGALHGLKDKISDKISLGA